jgi:hypothetical protein
MTAVRRLLAALAVLALATGCPGPASEPTSVDEKRLAVAKSEPLLARDKQPSARAGFQTSKKVPAHRGSVDANLIDETAADPDATARARSAEFVQQLRAAGWTVYLTACIPPRAQGSPAPDKDDVPPVQYADGWAFVAHAYKVVDGVSYFAAIDGHGSAGNKRVRVNLRLLVPQSTEPKADLFPDRPPPVAATTSCLDTAAPPAQRIVDGQAIEVDSDGPHPDGTPKPNGHR